MSHDNNYMDIDSLGPLETVDCMLCGSNQTRTVTIQQWFGEEFHVVKCIHCNLIFTNPRPSLQWRTHYYDPRYNPLMKELCRDFLYLPAQDRVLAFSRLLEFIKSNIGTGDKFLDVGCAGGQFVKIALEHGFKATGIDPSPGAIAYADEHYGLKLLLGEADKIPVSDNTYDVVTILHVIEHFREPIKTLKEVMRILKPGGILLVETPNSLRFYLLERYFSLLKLAFLKVHNRIGPKWEKEIPWYPFDHYYHWTSDTLLMALRKTGFQKCRSHILRDFSSSMPVNRHFPMYHKIYINLVQSLHTISKQKLNLWGVLIATGTKP